MIGAIVDHFRSTHELVLVSYTLNEEAESSRHRVDPALCIRASYCQNFNLAFDILKEVRRLFGQNSEEDWRIRSRSHWAPPPDGTSVHLQMIHYIIMHYRANIYFSAA